MVGSIFLRWGAHPTVQVGVHLWPTPLTRRARRVLFDTVCVSLILGNVEHVSRTTLETYETQRCIACVHRRHSAAHCTDASALFEQRACGPFFAATQLRSRNRRGRRPALRSKPSSI